MSVAFDPTHRNRLAHETSPYLLQHQHNPVDWWPWGPAALAVLQLIPRLAATLDRRVSPVAPTR